ncbi:MAG TPA: VCBS repeat-containing protein, partial [Candidatus Acidoferrales bacterium]|nr:VCBS repeat-containing protein [Candidatus Acidoferrales bacterium]
MSLRIARTLSALLFVPLICTLAWTHQTPTTNNPIAYFTDEAAKARLRAQTVFGGVGTKKYIIETTGTGVAIFDYDNDGWPDIFVVNGTTLDTATSASGPTNHLYRNNHDGTFTDVTEKAGLHHGGWGQGVCVGDYDNDGNEDLFVTYYGENVLYHNN